MTEFTGSNLNNIRHYCGGQTFARPGQSRTSGNRFGGCGVYGNIEYNDIRTGAIYPDSDPDDNSLDSAEFEVILDQSMNRGAALELNINPKETANVGALVVDNRLTTTRRQPHRLAIDTDRMPWSAFSFRTKEIAKTLRRGWSQPRPQYSLANTLKRGVGELRTHLRLPGDRAARSRQL